MGEFIKVTTVDDVESGEMKTYEVNGQGIIIGNWEGTYYAFEEICPHADGSLVYGWMMDGVVECPFHAGQYDLHTGEPIMPPAEGILKVYPVKVEGEDVKVDLSP